MRDINQVFVAIRIFIFSSFLLLGCATIPQLKVNYRLPPKNDTLSGKKVTLVTEDARESTEFLTPTAYEAFKDFSGNISLSVAKDNQAPVDVGLFRPLFTVKEGFKRRLENEGVEVEYFESGEEIKFVVILNNFELDLVEKKWIVEMGCEVRLMKGNRFLASQSVSGRGERIKMLGIDEAGILVGDVFTDLINRVDIEGLFRRAKLL